MNTLYILVPSKPSDDLNKMIKSFTEDTNYIIIDDYKDIPDLKNKKILFAVQLNKSGFNINLYNMLNELHLRGDDSLNDSTGAILIHSYNDLYTKTVSQDIIFHANLLGCSFPGRPIVEATGSLKNFLTMQKVIDLPLEEVCISCCIELKERFLDYNPKKIKNSKLLVLHASNYTTSNSLKLWEMIKNNLNGLDISEIHIENGTVRDCKGCSYKTCKHYGKQTNCFYGGIMVEEVYPKILESNAILWICPNYNDAVSANLTAVINRLTALYRKTKLFDKTLFGIIVSGNSGSDSVAKQLISALNINKTFRLPPKFCIMETANDKDAILNVHDIEFKAKTFANHILNEIKE